LGNLNPRIAVLSATEQPSPAMPSSLVAEQVAQRAKDFVAGAIVEGPMALDNAISAEAAAIKGIDSAVAGRAEVLLVPNIETGNALFKAMVYMLSATAAGVVLGVRVPIVLTSRADPPEARLASVALGAVISNYEASQ
jgi:phosphate acetyltransferase